MQLQTIRNKIYDVRDQRVMLDFDLAEIYQVATKRLKEAVRRNIERFPEDFMFELTDEEYNSLKDSLRSQIASSSSASNEELQEDHGGRRYMPFAFTEEGVAMLSGVLHSKVAIDVNITIMRAFVTLRNQLASTSVAVAAELAEIKAQQILLERKFDERHEAVAHRLNTRERESEYRRSRPRPKRLSYEIKIRDYSRKAVVIFTENPDDAQLLLAIGARHNSWLTWQGERVKGWVFPKWRFDEILQLLPEDWFLKKSNRHEK